MRLVSGELVSGLIMSGEPVNGLIVSGFLQYAFLQFGEETNSLTHCSPLTIHPINHSPNKPLTQSTTLNQTLTLN